MSQTSWAYKWKLGALIDIGTPQIFARGSIERLKPGNPAWQAPGRVDHPNKYRRPDAALCLVRLARRRGELRQAHVQSTGAQVAVLGVLFAANGVAHHQRAQVADRLWRKQAERSLHQRRAGPGVV